MASGLRVHLISRQANYRNNMSITEEFNSIKHNTGELSRNLKPITEMGGQEESLPARPTGRTDSLTDAVLWASTIEDEVSEDTTTPRLVIRGAQTTPPTPKEQKTIIDWLAFTSHETTDILKEFINIFIPNATFFPMGKGWQGYKNHSVINLFGKRIGLLAYGGNNERPYLSLSGDGCRKIDNWALVTHYLSILEDVRFSRVDIAADYYFGEITREEVDLAYSLDKFKLPKSRNNPLWDPRNPTGGDGSPKGWTRYVGKRDSGKYLRIYHKGAEQFGKLDEETQEKLCRNWEEINIGDGYNAPENATYKDWVRVEIEYGSKNRILPLEIIEQRDDYFAGAFPYLSEILPMANPIRPKTLPNNLETEIEIMFNNIRNQYGSFFTTMLSSGMKPEEILAKCVNGKHSQRIFKAGGMEIAKPFDPKVLAPQDE